MCRGYGAMPNICVFGTLATSQQVSVGSSPPVGFENLRQHECVHVALIPWNGAHAIPRFGASGNVTTFAHVIRVTDPVA